MPQWLKEVPLDALDRKPLRYDPDKGVLYSVDVDLKDAMPPLPKKPGLSIQGPQPIFLLRQ